MRLRYIHIKDLPPLEDVEFHFQHESLLGRQCTIRFVVGVNGSGKTRLLRALTEVFVQLERAKTLKLPFPVTLAYDVGTGDAAHSVYLHCPGKHEGSRLAIFDYVLSASTDWANLNIESLPDDRLYKDGELPGASSIAANMPKAVVAYTSGSTRLWKQLFDAPPPDVDVTLEEDSEVRPPGWTVQQERIYLASETPTGLPEAEPEATSSTQSRISYLVTTDDLKLAALAVTLIQAVKDFEAASTVDSQQTFVEALRREKLEGQTGHGLRGLLNEVDWLWPVHIGLHIELDMNSLLVRRNRARIRRLYQAASSAIKQPDPSEIRLLSFDLQRPTATENEDLPVISTAQALSEALADSEDSYTAFDIYRTLYELRQQGILKGVEIALQKTNLSEVLLYDWLSDGEQEFLGRMALFNLFTTSYSVQSLSENEKAVLGSDVLMILDEPETHFNDYWKRRIVDIISRPQSVSVPLSKRCAD